MSLLQVVPLVCLVVMASQVHAQDVLHLVCTGVVEQTTDLAKKERSQEKIDVTVDLEAKTAEIEGYWGCTADTALAAGAKHQCLGAQSIRVSDADLRYFASAENDMYRGQTSFIINRYSGTFAVNSSAFAKPAAGARWSYISITAKMDCTQRQKTF